MAATSSDHLDWWGYHFGFMLLAALLLGGTGLVGYIAGVWLQAKLNPPPPSPGESA